MELRKQELIMLRGDGKRERKEWEKIYDYDYYDDVGNSQEHSRPVLGGSSSLPYPRRGRTIQSPDAGRQISSLSIFLCPLHLIRATK